MAGKSRFFRGMIRVAVGILVVIITVGAAYFLGVKAAGIINERRADKMEAEMLVARDSTTVEILKKMDTVHAGDTLFDYQFVDLAGDTVNLADQVTGKTLMTFITAACPACARELERIAALAAEAPASSRVVLVAGDRVEDLTAMRDKYGLTCPILRDIKGEYSAYYGIMSVPFNIIVDENLAVENIIVGIMTEREIEKVISTN